MEKEHEFVEDPRYKIGLKQAAIVGAVYVVYCLGAILLAFPMSIFRPKDMAIKFIMGFPDWVFWSIIVWPVIMCIALIAVVLFAFKPVDLGPLDQPASGKGVQGQ
ncbi:MAG: YhdT family protein [Ignavibacteriales bacterium]